jgi:3-oxoacyl-[acyl-carrier protein] reductase
LTSGQAKILETNPSVKVHIFVEDVTDCSAISATFSKIHEEIGPINICVSNASFLSSLSPIAASDISDWFQSFEVMVKGAIFVAQEFLKHKAEKDSAFINISSSAAQMGPVPGFSAYASAKVGVGKAMEYLQSENKDVRIVSVHPGTIRSEMSESAEKAYGIEFTFDECKFEVLMLQCCGPMLT